MIERALSAHRNMVEENKTSKSGEIMSDELRYWYTKITYQLEEKLRTLKFMLLSERVDSEYKVSL